MAELSHVASGPHNTSHIFAALAHRKPKKLLRFPGLVRKRSAARALTRP